MRCFVIYSHTSGHHDFTKELALVEKVLLRRYEKVDFFCSFSAKEGREAAREACSKYEAIIVVGGDGTFNNFVNAVAKEPHVPPIGYLNFGTIGDVGKNFGVGKDLRQALKIIEKGYTKPIDIGEINGKYFAYVCTIGRFADIAYMTPRHLKRRLGKIAYYNAALAELKDKRTLHVVIDADGGHYEMDTPFLLLLNGSNVGGFLVNDYADMSDGKMEILMAKADFLNGVYHMLTRQKTIVITAKSFHISTDSEMAWCLDGEAGPTGDAEIVTHHNLLTVFTKKKPFSKR